MPARSGNRASGGLHRDPTPSAGALVVSDDKSRIHIFIQPFFQTATDRAFAACKSAVCHLSVVASVRAPLAKILNVFPDIALSHEFSYIHYVYSSGFPIVKGLPDVVSGIAVCYTLHLEFNVQRMHNCLTVV